MSIRPNTNWGRQISIYHLAVTMLCSRKWQPFSSLQTEIVSQSLVFPHFQISNFYCTKVSHINIVKLRYPWQYCLHHKKHNFQIVATFLTAFHMLTILLFCQNIRYSKCINIPYFQVLVQNTMNSWCMNVKLFHMKYVNHFLTGYEQRSHFLELLLWQDVPNWFFIYSLVHCFDVHFNPLKTSFIY